MTFDTTNIYGSNLLYLKLEIGYDDLFIEFRFFTRLHQCLKHCIFACNQYQVCKSNCCNSSISFS